MSFGSELQDIQSVNNFISNDIAFIQDFRDLVKERASIEKEYIHKLENLQKKCVQKSEKRGLTLSIGTVKAQNGDTTIPNISTFQQVYDKFLAKFDDTVKERNEYVTKLNTLSDNIKAKIAKKEELRKKHMDYYTKINTEVSNMSAETDKNESKFREACNNTDALKKKCDRSDVSNDDKKSKKNLDQSIIDMNNKKNAYILSIKVSNAYNDKLINVENHNILDNMQEFHESAVDYYKSICNEYLENENELCQNIEGFNEEVVEGNNQIDTPNDIQLYIKYNRPRDWRKPEVKTFASISLWDIKDNIYTNDANAITFLRNTLLKLQQNLSIHKDDIATKNKELDGISTMIQTYKATPSFGDSDDVLQKYIDTKKEIALLQLEELKCEVQINAITEAIGCDQMSIVPHNFKNKKIINKAICSLCGESLWGKCLSCKECGYLCHTKCELNVPPNCTKVKLPKNKRGSVNSVNSLPVNSNERISTIIPTSHTIMNIPSSTSYVTSPTSAKNPFMDDDDDDDDCNNSNPFSSSSDINLSGLQTMVAIYDYTKQNADEINLRTGEEVTIIENDKGDGWVKVSCSSGTGLVPANYLEPVANNLPNYTTSNNNHTSFLSNLKRAKVIYDYQGQVDEELTVTQDEIVTFIENSEPGWIKVKNETTGNIGLIPESYVEYLTT